MYQNLITDTFTQSCIILKSSIPKNLISIIMAAAIILKYVLSYIMQVLPGLQNQESPGSLFILNPIQQSLKQSGGRKNLKE